MRAFLLVAILLLPAIAAEGILIGKVVPNLPGVEALDEGFWLWARTPTNAGDYSITDGEDTMVLPSVLVGPEGMWFVGNREAFASHGIDGVQYAATPNFRLGNERDQLSLLQGNRVIDEFRWGEAGWPDYQSAGLVFTRNFNAGVPVDHDVGSDWISGRVHRVGESVIAPKEFSADFVEPYLLPDHGREVIAKFILEADEFLSIHVYDFRDWQVASWIRDAAVRNPNLSINVLVDGQVVGQSESDAKLRDDVLSYLNNQGVATYIADSGRYRFHHLKVFVSEDGVLVQSENIHPGSLPLATTTGNRGWGVRIGDQEIAAWFEAILEEDRNAWDVQPFTKSSAKLGALDAGPVGNYFPRARAPTFSNVNLQFVIGPDHTAEQANDPILALLTGATNRIYSQQLQLTRTDSNAIGYSASNAWVAAMDSKARQVDLRVQLQPSFSGEPGENEAIAKQLNKAGGDAFIWSDSPLRTLHNKGWVIDDSVVVGSMNGGFASRSNNREVSVIMSNPDVASVYANWFLADEVMVGWSFPTPAITTPMLVVALLLARRLHG